MSRLEGGVGFLEGGELGAEGLEFVLGVLEFGFEDEYFFG